MRASLNNKSQCSPRKFAHARCGLSRTIEAGSGCYCVLDTRVLENVPRFIHLSAAFHRGDWGQSALVSLYGRLYSVVIQPNGLPAVLGETHVCHDISASRRAMAGSIAGEYFLAMAIISSTFWRPYKNPLRVATTNPRTSSGSSLIKSLWTTIPLLTAVTPQSAYQKTRAFVLPRISTLGT